jgi:hypothetical protein
MDFLLQPEQGEVEGKITRKDLAQKELATRLAEDILHYQKSLGSLPDCPVPATCGICSFSGGLAVVMATSFKVRACSTPFRGFKSGTRTLPRQGKSLSTTEVPHIGFGFLAGGVSARQPSPEGVNLFALSFVAGKKIRDSESSYRTCISHCASCAQRNPKAPERSMLGAIIKSLPCSVNLYAWGKYQIDPCGW